MFHLILTVRPWPNHPGMMYWYGLGNWWHFQLWGIAKVWN